MSKLVNETKYLNQKTNLSDFTFLIPLRIDSNERTENVNTVIEFILHYFHTSIIIVEGGFERKYFPSKNLSNLRYEFFHDTKSYFHKTKYIAKLIEFSETKFIVVWDTDVLAATNQIVDSVKVIREGKASLSLPYDGRVFICDSSLSNLYKSYHDLTILSKLSSSLQLMYGYHSTGGAFFADKVEYLSAGGENQNFLGWGPEDVERIKRMEVKGISIHYSDGPLFHLWHPRGQTSWYDNSLIEIQNRKELIETCKRIL